MNTLLNERSTPAAESSTFESEVLVQLPSLYGKALRLTHHVQDAEDLVQETMFKAFRYSSTFQPGTNLRAWLFRILATSAITRYRKNTLTPVLSSLPAGEEFYHSHQIWDLLGRDCLESAEEEVLASSLDEDVFRALKELPPNYRKAFLLAEVDTLSYKEIAEVLQIPIGTVMSRISRAKRHLQKSLWPYARERGYSWTLLEAVEGTSEERNVPSRSPLPALSL